MTARRRDLGNRGRALVAAAAVGSAGVLAGWMAATDHAASTPSDASSTAVAGSSGASSSSSGTSSQSTFDDDDRAAVPGSTQTPSALPQARTGGS